MNRATLSTDRMTEKKQTKVLNDCRLAKCWAMYNEYPEWVYTIY